MDGFSDAYTMYVYPLWVGSLGRFTSFFPFSVGEFMIIAGILWLLVLFLGAASVLIHKILLFIKKKKSDPAEDEKNSSAEESQKNAGFAQIAKKFYLAFAGATIPLLSVITLVMTLNCFINYRCTPIIETEGSGKEYTVKELAELRDFIVGKCNELSEEIPRDEDGSIIFYADMEEEIISEAKKSMASLGDRFPKLSGFYVTPKALAFSGFVSQQNMMGYFFPFSMEANYNDIMADMNKPFTICHELSHTKSYIMEDEANYIAYLACTGSDNIYFEYSGYLGVLNYVNNAFYRNVSKEEYDLHTPISDKVRGDNIFLTRKAWEKVEDTAVISTETARKAADTFVDTTLKANGIDDGIASYSRVVELILIDFYERETKS